MTVIDKISFGENLNVSNIAVDKCSKREITLCFGQIEKIIDMLSSVIPYGKTVLMVEKVTDATIDMKHRLLKKGVKVVIMEISKSSFSVDSVKDIFNLPIDVRAVTVLSESLYNIGNYYSNIRNIPMILYSQKYFPQSIAYEQVFIRNNGIIDSIKNIAPLNIITDHENVNFKENAVISIISSLIYMVDYLAVNLILAKKTDNEYIKFVVNAIGGLLRADKENIDGNIIETCHKLKMYEIYNLKSTVIGAIDSLFILKGEEDMEELMCYQCAYIKLLKSELKKASSVNTEIIEASKTKGYTELINEMSKSFSLKENWLSERAVNNIFMVIDGKITLNSIMKEKFMYEIIYMLNHTCDFCPAYEKIMKKPLLKEQNQLKLMGLSPFSLNFMSLFLR